jgi:hypothetical protein
MSGATRTRKLLRSACIAYLALGATFLLVLCALTGLSHSGIDLLPQSVQQNAVLWNWMWRIAVFWGVSSSVLIVVTLQFLSSRQRAD